MAESTPEQWHRVDTYLNEQLVLPDAALQHALQAQEAAGLPAIEVTPLAGKFLNMLVRMSGAKRVLEIGTLGGYSTIWLARAVGDEGSVTTIEAEPDNAAIARDSIDSAGIGERVRILIGRGADVLPSLVTEPAFDLIFIDADKESNTIYLDWAAKLGHSGTVIVLDNIGRDGEVANPESDDPKVIGTREGLAMLARDPRFDATALQTIGSKGWDGVALAIVN